MSLEASDNMVCNTRAHNLYKHARENDGIFLQRMNNPQPTGLRDIVLDNDLRKKSLNPRLYTCNDWITKRGMNASGCEASKPMCQGWSCYTAYNLNDFLLTPCKTNTWRNHIACDDDKCCSVHHQMYMNMTRRI